MTDCLHRKSQGTLKKKKKPLLELGSEFGKTAKHKTKNTKIYFHVLFYFYILSRNTEIPKFKKKTTFKNIDIPILNKILETRIQKHIKNYAL